MSVAGEKRRSDRNEDLTRWALASGPYGNTRIIRYAEINPPSHCVTLLSLRYRRRRPMLQKPITAEASSQMEDGSGTTATAATGPCSKPPSIKAVTKSLESNWRSPFQSPSSQPALFASSTSYFPAWKAETKSVLENSPSRFESPNQVRLRSLTQKVWSLVSRSPSWFTSNCGR